MSKKKMTLSAVARIYSATSKRNNGLIPKNSFAARAMRSVMKRKKTN